MTNHNPLSRRLFLAAAAAGAAGAASTATAAATPGNAAAGARGAVSVPANGRKYERVPLRRDSVVVSAVQSRIRAVDGKAPARGIRENLAHMIGLIDKTQYYGGRKDLLCFHEFPLQGWDAWDRAELERLSIDLPGEETEALGAKAKEYGCYIQFGAYARDPDWPGHVLSITSIIGPDGKLVARDWKARNIVGVFPDFELVTTTVYNVLDRFVEMYGVDALVPVHRTDIGNLATSSTQLEPEIFRVMALKGAELLLRTASGGFEAEDIQMVSRYNRVFSVIVNNAVSPDNPHFMDDANGRSGGTAIYGPRGEALASAGSKFEQDVIARLPMAQYRATHSIPDVHLALYAAAFAAYQPRQAPGLFSKYLPKDLKDAKRFLDAEDRWR